MPIGKQRIALLLTGIALSAILSPFRAGASDNSCGPMTPAEEELVKLRIDNNLLTKGIAQCEAEKGIFVERLHRKKAQRLREIAANVKLQRQATGDFEGFVTWMNTNLAGYNRFIQAGSCAAVAAKMLPVPYAGQASLFTKFAAQFTLSLNTASVAITTYLTSSQKFIAMADAIDPAKPLDEKALAEAAQFADQKLLKEMDDVQGKLATLSDLSAGALSFLETVNHYVCGTDEYWNKMKGVFKKDINPKEKSFISENISSLKARAERFNGTLRSFGELGKKETASVKALAVYDELAAEAVSQKK